jgi:hypothetical protein
VTLLAKQPSLVGFQAGALEAKHAALCEATGMAPAKVRRSGGESRERGAASGS